MIWQDLTSEDVGRLDRRVPVVLPVAAIEQHGPHLPLSTDRLIAEHFAARLSEAMPEHVLILPAVSVGCSRHHMDFAGSLTVSHDTFMRYVVEILESVVAHGFKTLVLLNAHGGNQGAARVIAEDFGTDHPECTVAVVTWWSVAREALERIRESGPGGVGHAGEFETSLIRLIAPEMVRSGSIGAAEAARTFPWAEGDMLRSAPVYLHRSMKQMTPTGVFGEPRAASAEKGRRITEAVLEELTRVIRDLW